MHSLLPVGRRAWMLGVIYFTSTAALRVVLFAREQKLLFLEMLFKYVTETDTTTCAQIFLAFTQGMETVTLIITATATSLLHKPVKGCLKRRRSWLAKHAWGGQSAGLGAAGIVQPGIGGVSIGVCKDLGKRFWYAMLSKKSGKFRCALVYILYRLTGHLGNFFCHLG